MEIKEISQLAAKIKGNIGKVLFGKDAELDLVLVALLGSGHALLDDVPGTGKTVLAKSLAKSVSCDFSRIQFTADLLPSDITGLNVYNQKEGEFQFQPGPAFTNILLADEINRATPRTQSALLEAMEEKQISIDGTTYPMKSPFIVMGTQNPIESYGTFPLPEAQLDRFLMKLSMGYPDREDEKSLLGRMESKDIIETLSPVVTDQQTTFVKSEVKKVTVSADVKNYVMDIVEATRNNPSLSAGVSTRGALALYKASQITAAMEGRDYVIPEDVKKEAVAVLSHRLLISSGSHITPLKVMEKILNDVKVPLENI